MKIALFQILMILAGCQTTLARAAEDNFMLSLLTCQTSWLEWKAGMPQVAQFKSHLNATYQDERQGGAYLPVAATSVLGLKVLQLFPQSVGTGVGVSVLLNAGFEATKSALAKQLGKPIKQCAKAEGASSCELELGEKKTLMLMEVSADKNPQTLLGCYYFYQK